MTVDCRRAAAIGALALWGARASAQAPPPIVAGAATQGYANVVALLAYDPDAQAAWFFCSGTVVATEAVLTAAHCIDEADFYEEQGLSLLVATGSDLIVNGVDDYSFIEEAIVHPSWQGFDTTPTYDIALLRLERALTGVQPATLSTQPPTSAWSATPLELVGFGVTGANRTDAGVKRVATVDYAGATTHFVTIDGVSNVCQGDSGGPMFRTVDGGRLLVGVHSYVEGATTGTDACTNGRGAAHRVDLVASWIESEVRESGAGAVTQDGYAASSSVGSLESGQSGCAVAPAPRRWWLWGALTLAVVGRQRSGSVRAAGWTRSIPRR